MHFDRVLTNPPFSIHWGNTEKDADGNAAWKPKFEAERFPYGQVPLGAKKADLMFLQHMLAVTRDGGMVATVLPHGVLFRGGEEKTIRAGIIEDDLLEAVIGVAPNLFYGTGIPACILVLRQRVQHGANRVSGKPAERQGKVLFINADREFFEGRAQNYLLPEHIEKIVTTFDEFRAIDGLSAIVDNATLKANGYNLNIRRYADNAPPPEPHDVRAHLVGGIPKAEVADKARLFSAHGLNPLDLLVERDAKYFDFAPALDTRQALKPVIEGNAGINAKEAAIRAAFEQWWQAHSDRITALSGQMDNASSLVALRADLLASFSQSLEAIGLLDPFQVRGIVAGFWYQTKYEFLTLQARGAKGVADAWRTSIVTALEDKASKESPLEHKLVKFLMSDFVEAITELEAKKAELDSQIKAASPKEAEGEDGEAAEAQEDEADEENAVDEAQLKAMLGAGYGIFSGDDVAWATLRFTPERARWVATERWHPNQTGQLLDDGSYELQIPYSDDRELIMDILKYGGDCQVIEPEQLKQRVAAEFKRGMQRYTHQGSIYSFTMKKQKTASLRRTKLINPKELDPLVLPVRKALDAISDGSGLSPEETISISLFATIAEQVAILRHKEKGEVAAQRLATAIEQMIQEGAIDEEVLDQMKADFFNLTLMIRSVPAIDVWQIVDNVTRK